MRGRSAVVLATLVGVACGGDSRVILHVTSWQSAAESALDVPAIRAFEAAHPEVIVEHELVSNQAEYREKVLTSIAAGTPPDVLLLDNTDVPAFVGSGTLLNLRPVARRAEVDFGAFVPTVLDMFRRGDAIFAFPKGFSPAVYYYNRRLFDAAGVPYPVDGWTFEDFVATTRRLTRDTDGDGRIDQWGTAVVRPFWAWQAMVWSGGGDILTADGTRASGALDGAATLGALRFLTALVLEHAVAPQPNAFRAATGNEVRLFASGKLALLPSGHWLIPNLQGQVSTPHLALGVVSFPRARDAEAATPLFASGWAVPANTRHRKLAVQLAAALAGEDAQRSRMRAGLELAAMTAVQVGGLAGDSIGVSAAFVRQVRFGRAPWGARIARFREVEAQLPEILDRVIVGREPVEAVTRDVARRIDQILAR